MPHINLKLYKGRTEEQKVKLTEAMVQDITKILGVDEGYVTVAIEDYEPEAWAEKVYKKEILNKKDLYKKPSYNPFE